MTLKRQLALAALGRGPGVAQMGVRGRRRAATVRGAHDVADLQQEGLDDLGQRLGLVVDRRGDRLEPDRPAAVLLDDGLEESPVEPVEPSLVDALPLQRFIGDGRADDAVGLRAPRVRDAPGRHRAGPAAVVIPGAGRHSEPLRERR